MIAQIAGLISAIALLILVCGALYVAYRPPTALRRLKWKDFETEFHPPASMVVVATVPAAPEQLGTANPAPSSVAPGPLLAEQASPAEVDNFQRIMALFDDEKYAEGLALAKQEVANEKDSQKAVGAEAFYLYIALTKGSHAAFGDLERHALAHPTNFNTLNWWAASLLRAGRLEDALKAWENALAHGANESDRVNAALAVQSVLSRLERSAQAKAVLRNELLRTKDPAERASLYLGLSSAYESEKSADQPNAFLMRELAIRSTPADTRQRLDLAWAYLKHKANELSFVHYRALLSQHADHVDAQNNAGVAAERLSLPLTTVAYYKAAKAAGETLASANLASRLVAAGFKEEATTILDEARKAKDVHRNVALAVGQLAETEVDEENRIEQITERVGRVRKWRVQHAEALLRETLSAEDVSGSYTGFPSALELETSPDGDLLGSFRFAKAKTARLIGRIEGAALAFKWSEVIPDPKDVYASLSRKAGHGVLVVRKDRLDGYWAEGPAELDSKNAGNWTEWQLTKNTAPSTELIPAPPTALIPS